MSDNVHGHYIDRLSSWRRMAAVAWSAPDDPTIYGTIDVDLTDALPFLADVGSRGGERLTVTHLVVKAIADTLRRHPECNGMIRRGRVYLRDSVDLSVLVAVPPEAGERDQGADLSEAMIRDADRKDLIEIAREIRRGARAVRKREDPFLERTKRLFDLLPPALLRRALALARFLEYDANLDLTRLGIPRDPFGSAIVTSVGMLGISEAFGPIPPFSGVAMLAAIGAVEERAVVRGGEIVARPLMRVIATFDHRFVDGFQGGRLGATFKTLIEDPAAHLWPASVPRVPRRPARKRPARGPRP